ncbi:hypothetical protein MTR67_023627 [Solanum verrucosum]|uniref:Endonuclease/exonuclease/phosphatase domain-containing protein n=1 Tax=Solanum verrucosum TaxID=315347 RepID=A0AAF0QX79_SOLVR|nr:hypothetical protein MTR67_023627 [Solanum verrucosum]
MGDFNSILTQEDRPIGSQVQEAEAMDFKECLSECNLSELQTRERNFTWTNEHVFSRIDRVIINATWMNMMPIYQVMAMDPLFSDHSPLGLLMEEQRDNQRRPFRFYNCIGQHSEFWMRVQKSWIMQDGGIKGVWRNLKRMKIEMQQLNKVEFIGVTGRVQQLRRELIDVTTRELPLVVTRRTRSQRGLIQAS